VFSLGRTEAVDVALLLFHKREKLRRGLEFQVLGYFISSGQARCRKHAIARKSARRASCDAQEIEAGIGQAGLETQAQGRPPSKVGARCSTRSFQMAIERLRSVVEIFVTAERA
jgi:hypothetical protein